MASKKKSGVGHKKTVATSKRPKAAARRKNSKAHAGQRKKPAEPKKKQRESHGRVEAAQTTGKKRAAIARKSKPPPQTATDQRDTQLAIIHSIQLGLAAKLTFQAIVDLVGDKLREMFNSPDLIIRWFDQKTKLIHFLYLCEHGKRRSIPPSRPIVAGLIQRLLRTRKPVLLRTVADKAKLKSTPIPGTASSLSSIHAPIIGSDRVLGAISVENYQRERAYGNAELDLLSTIAASLGTALESARLFEETQHLLKETEQRAAELAVINSI